jgi:uncharacterized delta-60 repeat protein
MKRKQWLLAGGVSALFGAVLISGCGDDSDDDGVAGGRGGMSQGTGGKATSGGKTGSGGVTTTGGNQGNAGAPDPGTAGAGGADEPGAGGAAGGDEPGTAGDGAGGAPVSAGPVAEVADSLIEGVHDLRGLVYAKDGKIYGSGHIGASTAEVDRRLAVVRLEADGSLDDSFGEGGIVSFNLREREVEEAPAGEGGAGGSGGSGGAGGAGSGEVVVSDGDEQSIGLVELANGDLMVQANVRDESGKGMDVVLLRLDDAGELVTSFGDDGLKRLDFGWTDDDASAWTLATGPSDQSWGLELDPSSDEEKVVVFGFGPAPVGAMTGDPAVQRTDNDRYVARLLASDGSLDPDFNDGKPFSFNSGGTFSDGGRRGLVEADGSILSAGYTNYGDGLGNHIVLIRLLPDGTPDPDFGFGIAAPGVVRANPFLDDGGVAECYNVAKQSNGRYVTTGYGRATIANGSSSYGWETTDAVDLVSFGVLPGGIDPSFGRAGTLAIQSEGLNLGNTEDRGRDVLALSDDRLVYAGRFGTAPAIFVVTANGELDASVGDEGRFVYEPLTDPTAHFFRVVASADGKRIAAATSNHADGVLVAVLEVGAE